MSEAPVPLPETRAAATSAGPWRDGGAPALADALFVQSPLSIALYDAAGRVGLGNAAYERHFGIRLADVPPDYSLFADPQLEAAGLLPLIRRAYAGETVALPPVRYDAARATGAAGRTIWTQGHCYPVRDAAGAVTHVVVVHVDVTAWAEAEAALHQVTAALEAHNARLQEQAVELQTANQQLQDQATELEMQAEELRVAGAELARRTEEADAARVAADRERENLGRILAQVPAAVAVYEGAELRFRAMSAAYQRIIGGREVLGRPVREALPDLGGQGFFELLEGVYASGRPVGGTNVPARWDDNGDGVPEDHTVEFTYAPLVGPDGRTDGVVALVLEVSERVRLEAAERDARAAAAESAAHAAAVLDSIPDAAAVLDAEWRYTYVNPAARALHAELLAAAAPAEGAGAPVVGRVAWEAFPWLVGTKFETESRRAVAERRLAEFVEYAAPLGRWFETRIVPTAVGVVALNRDVTAQRASDADRERLLVAERVARERTERLQRVTAALSQAATPAEIAAAVCEHGAAALGAVTGAAYAVGEAGTALELLAQVGLSGEAEAAYRRIPLSAPLPLPEAVRDGTSIFAPDRGALADRYPGVDAAVAEVGAEAWVATPLQAGGQALGVIAFGFAAPRDFTPEDRAVAEALAQQCAQALERARLFDAERQGAERARRLQRLTARLNEATSREQIADVVFEGALAAVAADAGSLAIVHDDATGEPAEFEIVRVTGYDAALSGRYRRFPVTPGRPLSDAVRERRLAFVGSTAELRARYPATAEDLGSQGYEAFAAIPVVAGDRVRAALSFSFRAPRVLDDATRTFLATVGEQCALALERQRLHDAELRHAERHAALLETIQDAFVALDRELRFTYANPRAEALLGRAAGELLGRRLVDALPEAAGTPIHDAIRRAAETGQVVELEAFSAIARRWVEARIYPAPDGVTLVLQDVSARRRAQDAAGFMAEASRLLSESLDYETTLRAVADAAVPRLGDWCAVDTVVDPTSGAWPPKMERLAVVHRDPEMLALGAELVRRYPTDWSAERGVAGVLRDGTPFFIPEVTDEMLVAGARDAEHLRLLRALHFSSIIVVPLVARGLRLGALTLCTTESARRYDDADLALARDLAQRAAVAVDNARLFRDAERARAEAEEANRAKSEFLATMSHELRTPLNAIQGHVQLLELELHGPVTAQQRDAFGRIDRAQRHLLGLINDILSYARLEGGRVEYDVRAVPVADVVRDVTPMVEPQLVAKGLTFEVRLPDGGGDAPVLVWADREKLAQILLNLLSNATKFTPAGGRVTVDLVDREDGSAPADQAFVRVRDTGVGIPRDKLEAIFEPFVQLRSAYSAGPSGTGLGLAISRDLARGMGGDLRARSAAGEGSTFTVALRRVVATTGAPTDRRTGEERRVDDERRRREDRRE